jgi:hypothetical protein
MVPRHFHTSQLLPDLSGHRFSSVQLGADRVQQIREEHAELRALAARVLDIPVDELTREAVVSYTPPPPLAEAR